MREYFGEDVPDDDATAYRPVIAIFAVAALLGRGLRWYSFAPFLSLRAVEWFFGLAMCFLAVQKLPDIESFSTMFLNYNLLAQRWVLYCKVYPFGEALAGILMVAGGVALGIGSGGAVYRHGRCVLGVQSRLH